MRRLLGGGTMSGGGCLDYLVRMLRTTGFGLEVEGDWGRGVGYELIYDNLMLMVKIGLVKILDSSPPVRPI